MPSVPENPAACRELLAQIRAALAIPYPQAVADERNYYILRSRRASVAVQALDRILTDPEAAAAHVAAVTELLAEQVADLPPDTYRHSGMPS